MQSIGADAVLVELVAGIATVLVSGGMWNHTGRWAVWRTGELISSHGATHTVCGGSPLNDKTGGGSTEKALKEKGKPPQRFETQERTTEDKIRKEEQILLQ